MVDVVPFNGLLFNQAKIGSLERVTSPPYDVISSIQQEALYEKSPYNIVRLIFGKEFSGDDEKNNRYARAARLFRQWIDEGVLIRDEKPGFYIYSQEYEVHGKPVRRLGFFARIKLEDFSAGNICPHEFTLAKAKKDRTLLLQACHANFSPIFGLFSDPEGTIDRNLEECVNQEPIAIINEDAVVHRFWRLQDAKTVSFLSESFKGKKVYIADGHHRYETALAFHKERGERFGACHDVFDESRLAVSYHPSYSPTDSLSVPFSPGGFSFSSLQLFPDRAFAERHGCGQNPRHS
jgi:uncharacterized protein (DUF1015 family)